MIDMNGDVDQEGWAYSTHFASGSWKGTCSTVHYVRKRKWTRTKRIRTITDPAQAVVKGEAGSMQYLHHPVKPGQFPLGFPPLPALPPSATSEPQFEFFCKLQGTRLDRERLECIKGLADTPECTRILKEHYPHIIQAFEHEAYQLKAAMLIGKRLDNSDRIELAKMVLDGFAFFASGQELLKVLEISPACLEGHTA
ncbi:uncharacterized protein BJ171DRAFT_535109 [Polychytrium aggregatum]|uniref:uncharacterized protein n=1 Tax=Polychytrium aggregatum TaxID=110093 RepID=UPI0022FECC92|nr:uncharacterized protein BJ171DRAFT_535109 [Polychytrium aggregatum]KAI9193048.1 hypothetical protein BJ171DRAFT_535109 [Polychytrium aggregatum]